VSIESLPRKLTILMQHPSPTTLRVAALTLVANTFACSTTHSPAVYGGEGATADGKERLLDAEPEKSYGACTGPAPASDTALVDDFEDGDHKPFRAFQREAWWFTVNDQSEGSKVTPVGDFKPELLPDGKPENRFAAHFTAEGQKTWGATFSTSMHFVKEGLKCPFNAGAFAGLKFRAKGPGRIEVAIPLPETVQAEAGGVCTERCYDTHRKTIFLTDEWAEYTVEWSQVQQGGWGAEVRFDPERILGINFVVGVADVPANFWIDDVAFTPKAP
jgi:hypothetical protein